MSRSRSLDRAFDPVGPFLFAVGGLLLVAAVLFSDGALLTFGAVMLVAALARALAGR